MKLKAEGRKRRGLCIVFVTASSPKEARAIARAVLEAKLAACVNIAPGVKSHFWWQGKLDSANEHLLVIKSHRRHFRKLCAAVRSHHSYQVPEIIATPVIESEKTYAQWWLQSLAPLEGRAPQEK